MWKIVERLEALVLYIYIYIYILIMKIRTLMESSSICLDTDESWTFAFMLFIFFKSTFQLSSGSGTIHEPHKPIFSTKLSLKIGHMALFTRLQIILL